MLGLIEILSLLIVLGGFLVLFVLFYKNIQDLMYEIAPHNRQVPPTNIWLMFIPLFNIVYGFIIYPKVCDSVRLELEERAQVQQGDYGRGLSVAMPVLRACMIVPFLNYLAMVVWLVIWIVFWVKTAEHKNTLRSLPAANAGGTGIKFTDTDLLD